MNKKEKTYISMRTTLATKIGDKLLPNFLNRDVYNSSVKRIVDVLCGSSTHDGLPNRELLKMYDLLKKEGK